MTNPAGVTDSQLAVLLRQTQWALDDAAHYAGGAGLSPQQRAELAGTLDALAEIIRASIPDGRTDDGPDVSLPPTTTEP